MRRRALLAACLFATACSGVPERPGSSSASSATGGSVSSTGSASASSSTASTSSSGSTASGSSSGTSSGSSTGTTGSGASTGSSGGSTGSTGSVGCGAPTGLLHDQPLMVGSETRHYMLYVPASYDCHQTWPLLVDFHGTWTGQESDMGEEYYALDGLLAAADAHGFIVARPRSRYSTESGTNIYRWDQNAGDLGLNVQFAHELVQALGGLYHLDPARTYAAGFSSGTNMTAQFFADQPQVFAGFGFVGGGIFTGEEPASYHVQGPPTPRVYAVSGYRDYLLPYELDMLDALSAHGLPDDHVFKRGSDNGHELYGWHYQEMLPWLDQGVRPAPGALQSGWVRETVPGTDDLTELSPDGADGGALVASASAGGLYRREADGTWSVTAHLAGAPPLSGICVLDSGVGFAVGQGHAARTADYGHTWTRATIPSFNPNYFDPPEANAVACHAGTVVSMGYWDAAHTDDGSTWSQTHIDITDFGVTYQGQGAEVKANASGTWLASGYYNYLARSTDGVTFTPVAPPVAVQWLMGIAPAPGGAWWVVGEAGTILASADDGQTWAAQASPSVEDLYAVAFFDATHGMAVGAHGAALLTTDGQHWSDVSAGLDLFLGDVTWLDAHTVLAIGEAGTALRYTVP